VIQPHHGSQKGSRLRRGAHPSGRDGAPGPLRPRPGGGMGRSGSDGEPAASVNALSRAKGLRQAWSKGSRARAGWATSRGADRRRTRGSSRQGCRSGGVQVPLPPIARFWAVSISAARGR